VFWREKKPKVESGLVKNWEHYGYEEMSSKRIHEIVDPIFQTTYAGGEFVAARPLFWIRSNNAPIRQIFYFEKWKGSAIAPGWGLSLDFVPHVAGRKLAWHRTMKSARADVSVEADEIEKSKGQHDMYYSAGPAHIADNAQRIIANVLPVANQFWQSFNETDKLLDGIHYSRNLPRGGMRAQLNLAEAFINARYGDIEAGRRLLDTELSNWQRHLIDDDFVRLNKSLTEAYERACIR
jgi:hypothetical protein